MRQRRLARRPTHRQEGLRWSCLTHGPSASTQTPQSRQSPRRRACTHEEQHSGLGFRAIGRSVIEAACVHAPVCIALDPERRGQHLQLSNEASGRRGHVDEARVAWSCPYRRDRARAAW